MQLSDDPVVVWIVLKAAAGVNGAGHAEAVELTHEVPRRIHLVFLRELRSFCQRGIQNHRVWPGDEQSGGIALLVALDLSADRFGRVFGIADGTQGCAV